MAAIGNSLMKSHISQDLGAVDPSEKIQIFPEKNGNIFPIFQIFSLFDAKLSDDLFSH